MKLWVNYPRDGKIGKNWIFSIKKCLKEYHFKNEFVEFRVIRGVFTWLMIGGFGLIIYGGPLALMLTVGFQFSPYKIFILYKKSVKLIHFISRVCTRLFNLIFFFYLQTLCVQVKCFSEIINIGYAVYRVHNLPWFRSLSWYNTLNDCL